MALEGKGSEICGARALEGGGYHCWWPFAGAEV